MAHRTPNPTDRSDLGADALLAELGWLRTLAGSLVRDPHLADDLVQDTCAIALQRRAEPRQPRAWLTTVLRHLLLAHRRREQIRERREHDRDEAVADDAVALLQRAEAQRELVGAVIALDEPYRSTVLLRFFDGLAPRRIAARQGVPVATVHSRLQRALTQLRTRLDRTAGGRPAWLAALAPFAATFPHPAFAGVVLMQTKLKIAVPATLLP
ncbi:MAG: RNA polymerase sigma factor, partial [Planctomycetes bacterium]|nr:RNA polymerase sigma factor [Planctomycetota bacterium]